ncbi:MAG: HEPN domain-containing protein [Pseudomonadota bacterium]
MATSMRYKELQRGVHKLRKALLPGKFDPTGTYRSAERTHLRAISFRILVHAEIESFIEDRAHELFDEACNAWTTHRVPSRVLSGLLAFSGHTMPTPPSKLGSSGKKDHDDIDGILSRAKKRWKDEIHKKNHGVKEPNVLALLLPLGIDGGDLDTTLLADLTSFGGSRGAVAHKSSVGVTTYADPKSENDQANQLVAALESIDELVGDALEELKKTKLALTP